MNPFSIIMFVLTFALLIAALLFFCGQTGLLVSFDRAKYKDKREYARFLGKIIAALALVAFVCGLICLVVKIIVSVILLILGIIAVIVISAKLAGRYYSD